MTAAAEPDPSVSVANWSNRSSTVDSGEFRRSTVRSIGWQGVVDLARIDHGARQPHGVHETEARIGEVEVDARRGQTEFCVHRHGRRGLKVFPTNRRVDEQANVVGANSGLRERFTPGHTGGIGETHTPRPPPTLRDSSKTFEQTALGSEPFVGRGEPLVDLG